MKARLEDWKKTLSQPWLLSLLMVAVIPLFPEYIAPLLAIGAVVAANADAKRRGRVLSVGPIGKLLLIFMLYTAFGVLYSKHPFNSFATFLMWMVMFLAYLSMTTVLTNRHRFDTALFCISVIAGIVGLVGLFQYALNCLAGIHVPNQFWGWLDNIALEWIPMDINIQIREMRFSSTFTNPNIVGEYLVMVVPFVVYYAFGGKRTGVRLLCRFCLLFAVCGIAFSFSRGSYLGLLVIVLILCITNAKRIVPFLLSLISLLILVPQSVLSRFLSIGGVDFSIAERFSIWEVALKTFGKSPIFGLGPGVENFWGVLLESGVNAPHAHNLVLQLLMEGGLIALALMVLMGWKIVRRGMDLMTRSPETHLLGGVFLAFAAGFVMNSMVDYPLLSPKLVGVFMMVMAIGDSACRVYLGHRVQPLADCFPAGELARRGLTVRIAASQDVARFHNK